MNAPNADIYVIDVSFKALQDKSERDYLNQLPTSFVLSDEAVDRLRAAAQTIILNSPDFQQVLKERACARCRSPRYRCDGRNRCSDGPDRRARSEIAYKSENRVVDHICYFQAQNGQTVSNLTLESNRE